MMINLKLEGFVEAVVRELVSRGIASNKTEAIRIAVLHYNEHFNIRNMERYIEDQKAIAKLSEMKEEIKSGKKKMLSKKDVLKKYSHLRDV